MKEDTKIVLDLLVKAIQMQNQALKDMANQISDMQKALEDIDARMATPTQTHNHFHYPDRSPLPHPITWTSGTTTWGSGGVTYTINNNPDDGPQPVKV